MSIFLIISGVISKNQLPESNVHKTQSYDVKRWKVGEERSDDTQRGSKEVVRGLNIPFEWFSLAREGIFLALEKGVSVFLYREIFQKRLPVAIKPEPLQSLRIMLEKQSFSHNASFLYALIPSI